LNLVINAADAVKSLPKDERQIAIAVSRGAAATVTMTVSDCGHGIATEHVARVFEPFFTTKAEGLGIGLAISRTIAEAHGGRLWATNNPDRGASLHLELPAA
jgi:two-component system sensor kinase FixL